MVNIIMNEVFISYSSEDRNKAKTLAEALECEGWIVWWDRKITPGKRFDTAISEALKVAKCVVVLWSKASIASDWVKEEATVGVKRQILVPAFLESVEAPLGFGRIQTADLTNWQPGKPDVGFTQLLQAIESHVARSVREPTVDRLTVGGNSVQERTASSPKTVPSGMHQSIKFWVMKWVFWGPLCGALLGLVLGIVDDGSRFFSLDSFATWVGGGAFWGLLGGLGVGALFGLLVHQFRSREERK